MTIFRNRLIHWAFIAAPWLLALLLAAGWGLSAWTPGYLERLVPQIAADMGLPLEEFHIRDAGLFSADIGPVRLGPEKGGLKLVNVHVTYTPSLLKQGRVNTVTLDGVSFGCNYDGDTFSLPVLKLLPKGNGTESKDKSLPELPFDSLVIKNSVLNCEVRGGAFSLPFSTTFTPGETLTFDATVTPRDQIISVKGALGPTLDDLSLHIAGDDLHLGAFNDLLPMPLEGSLGLDLKAAANLSEPEAVTAEIKATISSPGLPDSGVKFKDGTAITLQAAVTDKAATFSLSPVEIEGPQPAKLAVSDGKATAEAASANFTLDGFGITLPGRFHAARADLGWEFSFTAANHDKLVVKTGGRDIRLSGLNLGVSGTTEPGKVSLTLVGGTQAASLGGTELRSGPVLLTLPLAWPAPRQHTPGNLKAAVLRHGTYKLGTLVAKLRQEGMALAMDGSLYSQLLPDLRVKLTGRASMETKDATFAFDIPKYVISDRFDPSGLVPAMKGVRLSGNLAVEGGVDIQDGNLSSRMGAFFTGGTLRIKPEDGTEKEGTTISGLRVYFESPDLIDFRSAPAQMLAFDSITAGPLSIGKGMVTFQLEPRGVVLVERLGFDWVGGHVASRAFRIVPGHKEYDVTLYCSHLRLSTLLGQLGLADAQGEAALSGELPVTWKKGKISFNNGFLHSTPGEGGTIRVEAMQDLVSAIPEGTPQRGQLELAQEAIKDFEYKWVRIKADTVGEDLLVRLSVDGKPASTLPFVYTKEFGGFMRVTGDVKGSNFQGLRLDVNFSLPLDRILLYKDIINMIE